eukprot:764178-Hanusia_phi.AAC.1
MFKLGKLEFSARCHEEKVLEGGGAARQQQSAATFQVSYYTLKEADYVIPWTQEGLRLKVRIEDRQQHDASDIRSTSKTWSEMEAERQLHKRGDDTWAGKFLLAKGKGRFWLGKAMRQVGGNIMRTAIQAITYTAPTNETTAVGATRHRPVQL